MKKLTRPLLPLLMTMCVGGMLYAQTQYKHPGLLHSQESVERIRRLVATENAVALGSYRKLMGDGKTSTQYAMRGPYTVIARDGDHRNTKTPSENDFLAAYYNALAYIITGDASHAAKSMQIIRAYASSLQIIDGHDAPLCAGLQGFILINACELMRYSYSDWTPADSRQTERMFKQAFLPVLDEFDRQSPYANGNWGAAVNKMRMALGVYLDNQEQYDRAKRFFIAGNDNGSLPCYIAPSGQCQETGRDQAHVMLGLGQLAETCEVAWSQGDDLWSALDNRLMEGYEYTSRVNLGLPVQFVRWVDLTGKYSNWHVVGEGGLGGWRAVFEIAYNHYVGRRHLAMPATATVLQHYVRPEGAGFTCDNPGFGSLLFYQDTPISKSDCADLSHARLPHYDTTVRRDYDVETEPVVRLDNVSKLVLVRTVDCWPEYWELTPVSKSGNSYEYRPKGALSRNGYRFAEGKTPTTFLGIYSKGDH